MTAFSRDLRPGDVIVVSLDWRVVALGPHNITNAESFKGDVAVIEKHPASVTDATKFYIPADRHVLHSSDDARAHFFDKLRELPLLELRQTFVVTHDLQTRKSLPVFDGIDCHDYDPKAARGTEIDRDIHFQAIACTADCQHDPSRPLRILFASNKRRASGFGTNDLFSNGMTPQERSEFDALQNSPDFMSLAT